MLRNSIFPINAVLHGLMALFKVWAVVQENAKTESLLKYFSKFNYYPNSINNVSKKLFLQFEKKYK